MRKGPALVRAVLVRAVLVAAVLALAACTGGDPFEALPVPPSNPSASTTTTALPDFSGVALAPVEGSTTTTEVAVGPGRATLAGQVDGPDGPVAGATVRLERLVGDAVATLDVATGDDGMWRAPDVLGGRYRVRAWLAPDLAAIEPQILFVPDGETAQVSLVVERFGATVVDLAVAPDPPEVGRRTSVVVRVSSQVVNDDGVVQVAPRPGVALALSAGGSWVLEGTGQGVSDAAGTVTFVLECAAPGPQPLTVTIPPGEVFPLAPPDCVVPPPPTTVSAPTPDEGSSTSTTSE